MHNASIKELQKYHDSLDEEKDFIEQIHLRLVMLKKKQDIYAGILAGAASIGLIIILIIISINK